MVLSTLSLTVPLLEGSGIGSDVPLVCCSITVGFCNSGGNTISGAVTVDVGWHSVGTCTLKFGVGWHNAVVLFITCWVGDGWITTILVPSPGAKRRQRAEGLWARVLISTGV